MKNKSLRFKLYLLCGFLLMIPVIVGGVSYWAMSNVINDYTRVTEWNLPGTRTIYEVLMQNRQARMNAYQIVMPDIKAERRLKVAGEIENIWKEYEKSSKEYLTVPFGPGEKELWENLKEPIESGRTATLKLVALYKKNPNDDSAERKEMIRVIVEEMNPSSAKSRAAGNALREYHTIKAKENTELAQASSAKGTKLTIMAIALASVVGIIFVGIFANSLVKTLTTISSALADASLQVGSGATQIASASQELSQATTEQASALEETAASIEEMNSMVSKNSDNAQQSSTISKSSHSNAQKGKDTVEQMIHSIDDISKANDNIMKQINHSNDQISEIVKVISEIGNKTKVINDIVFQTKLLSFNASVEAARAGENGKGFAVVAEEVGNLAQMSGNAAAEITAMLDESIKKVEGIVSETKTSVSRLVDEGKRKVDTGTQIAKACGNVLEEIVVSVSSVSNMAAEISTASVEQSLGIKEITKAMNSLDQVTQQNSATSEQAAGAAEELSGQAEALTALVHELEIAVHGHSLMTTKKNHTKAKKEGKVLAMKPKIVAKAAPVYESMVTKKASGEASTPAHDDKRFSDV